MMDQLVWCGRIKNGISLTAPNETLASAYLKKAEELTPGTEITYSATTSSSIRRGAAYNEREP